MTSKPTPKRFIPRKKNCSDCRLESKEIYFSNKFQANLCMDCLTNRMLDQIHKRNS